MATLRRTYVTCVLMAACSSADPSTDTSALQGVLAIDPSANCNGECPQETIAGAALAQGSVWFTRSTLLFGCPNNGNCTITTASASLGVASFQDGGASSLLESTPTFANPGTLAWSGVDVTPDGSVAYFAYADSKANGMVYDALAGSADAGHVTQPTIGHVIGVAADQGAAIVALSPPTSSNGGDWNQGLDQGNYTGGGGPQSTTSASLYRVNFADGGISPALSVPFDTTASQHVFTFDAANVYGVGNGHVWSAPRDLSAMTDVTTSIPAGKNDCTNGTCTMIAPVGIAAANGAVITSFLSASFVGGSNNTQPSITPTRCQIFNGGTPIFDVTAKGCAGVAADASYAYFAILEQKQVTESCCGTSSYLATTSVARILLTGTATQVPSIIPIDTNRFYGPRRFLIDDTYVYGIDPAYVFRIAKSAFK